MQDIWHSEEYSVHWGNIIDIVGGTMLTLESVQLRDINSTVESTIIAVQEITIKNDS